MAEVTGHQYWRVEVGPSGDGPWESYGGRPFARVDSALAVARVALCSRPDAAIARVCNVATGEVWELKRLRTPSLSEE